jgi:hypothetical protein
MARASRKRKLLQQISGAGGRKRQQISSTPHETKPDPGAPYDRETRGLGLSKLCIEGGAPGECQLDELPKLGQVVSVPLGVCQVITTQENGRIVGLGEGLLDA